MFWDRVAWAYDIFANIINRKVHKKLCMDVSALFSSEDIVLECACGTGMLTVHIAPRCKKIVATDLSENMLKKTRKKCRSFDNVICEKTNITDLHYGDNSFDVVLAANVIHLLPEPEKALREMSRVCKAGGRLVIPTYVAIRNDDAIRCGRDDVKQSDSDSVESVHGDAMRSGTDKNRADSRRNDDKNLNALSTVIGKMGAGFQRQFTPESYRVFFSDMGYGDVEYFVVDGRLPCAVAVIRNHKEVTE